VLSTTAVLVMSGFAAGAALAQQPAETAIPDKVRLFIPYKDYSAEDNQRVLEMYKWLRVADVSDGMDVVGLQDIGIVDEQIRALWKDTEKFTHRTVGIAVTARYVPSNRREPQMDNKTVSRWYGTITTEAFMKVLHPGSVLVIDAMEDGESRSIGSSNILSWKKLGMVGLVTSGGLADTDEIIYHKVPVWFRRYARGFRPGRNELESVNRPVTMAVCSCVPATSSLPTAMGSSWSRASGPRRSPRRHFPSSITSRASDTSRKRGRTRGQRSPAADPNETGYCQEGRPGRPVRRLRSIRQWRCAIRISRPGFPSGASTSAAVR